jgi:hypothetical protein
VKSDLILKYESINACLIDQSNYYLQNSNVNIIEFIKFFNQKKDPEVNAFISKFEGADNSLDKYINNLNGFILLDELAKIITELATIIQ